MTRVRTGKGDEEREAIAFEEVVEIWDGDERCRELDEAVREYRRLKDEIDELESEQKGYKEAFGRLARELGLEGSTVDGDGWQLIHTVKKPSTGVDPRRLVEKGVGVEVIEYATVVTRKGGDYFTVRKTG